MKNFKKALIQQRGQDTRGQTERMLHWVFDIKMDLLQRKARLVANKNKTDPPKDLKLT